MVGPRRQGAADAVPEPAARTPERQALAQAIADRDHVAAVLRARRDLVPGFFEARKPLYGEVDRLKALVGARPASDRHRLDALLRGEEPAAKSDYELAAEQLAQIEVQIEESRSQEQRVEADIRLLEGDLEARERDVRQCAAAVVRADPAQAAVSAELRVLNKRRTLLGRAAGGALNEYVPGDPNRFDAGLGSLIVPVNELVPCPWATARARLLIDPDAVLPMPADVA